MRIADDAALVQLLGLVAEDVVAKANFVEEWFAEGSSLNIPLALSEAVERECNELGLRGNPLAVLAIGEADNFGCLPFDLVNYLFRNSNIAQPVPSNLPKLKFAFVQVPRLEGGGGLWWPIVVGHELAHLAVEAKGTMAALKLASKIPWKKLSTTTDRTAFLETAENWAEELICDAYSVVRFGSAGAVALVELLDLLGATDSVSPSHPPGWLRFRLALDWVGDISGSATEPMLGHCAELAALPAPAALDADGQVLAQLFVRLKKELFAIPLSWAAQYQVKTREAVVVGASEDLQHGIPPRPDRLVPLELGEADVINAGWIEWYKDCPWPVGKLVTKGLDTLSFIRHWEEGGGGIGLQSHEKPASHPGAGILAGSAILERTKRSWNDKNPLIVTPLLPHSLHEASLDVRLGPQFIVFHRTDTASIRTFDPDWDAREVQRRVEVGWGERFVLHPNELALASTLEYVSLPSDLAAQVVTRSSYGRLGLITATAVQVHPFFHGCLTLELLNLGLAPLQLMPGERIAQLVFMTVVPNASAPTVQSRNCPIGPEFSRPPQQTIENRILASMSERAEKRGK